MTAARSDLMALADCPFCGGSLASHTDLHEDWHQIVCGSCGCRSNEFPGSDGPDKAARSWNTRTASQPDRKALEPFLKAARIIQQRPRDYGNIRIATFGGLIDAHDLYPKHFLSLLSGAGTKSDGGVDIASLDMGDNEGGDDEDAILAASGPSGPSPGPDVREALEAACARLQSFLDTFGDLGDCVTQADIDDWSALTRPLGGFVQERIARKQSTDLEGSSRTETAGGEA